jgi:hypothetical protein
VISKAAWHTDRQSGVVYPPLSPVGKFSIADIFDTNKYANNPETAFLNWSLTNAGAFGCAGWGNTY